MAKTDEYLNEACRELERMSADEQAKLEYEAREKALRDHNYLMKSNWEAGIGSRKESWYGSRRENRNK